MKKYLLFCEIILEKLELVNESSSENRITKLNKLSLRKMKRMFMLLIVMLFGVGLVGCNNETQSNKERTKEEMSVKKEQNEILYNNIETINEEEVEEIVNDVTIFIRIKKKNLEIFNQWKLQKLR